MLYQSPVGLLKAEHCHFFRQSCDLRLLTLHYFGPLVYICLLNLGMGLGVRGVGHLSFSEVFFEFVAPSLSIQFSSIETYFMFFF